MLIPLALAQFICSFAGSNMNVMINDISEDLNTTVQGVQLAITLFLLVMAALMIPGGKLTDRYGRKRCLNAGLVVFGVGALLSAFAPGLPVLIIGNSILEGVGTALLIPPVYILTTLLFADVDRRARAFGVDQRDGRHRRGHRTADRRADRDGAQLAGGVRLPGAGHRGDRGAEPARRPRPAAAGPEPPVRHRRRGAVRGRARPDRHGHPGGRRQRLADAPGCILAGVLVLAGFFHWMRARERAGREALLSTALFRNRTSNLGLITQNIQWLVLMGISFVVSAFLQVVRGYNSIQTGLILTAATVGPAAVVPRRGAPRAAALAAHPHRGRLRPHDRRHRRSSSSWSPSRRTSGRSCPGSS